MNMKHLAGLTSIMLSLLAMFAGFGAIAERSMLLAVVSGVLLAVSATALLICTDY